MAESKQSVALASVGSSAVLAGIKFIVGIATGSLGILADAFDSLLDIIATGITFLVVRFADLPPDENHPYGHARAENLGALAGTVLLFTTAGWVLWQAFDRILFNPAVPEITVWSFLVILVSLVINILRVQALRRAAAQFKSPTFEANAANFTTDILSSLVVLVSLVLIGLNYWLPMPDWLIRRADALAALVVAGVLLYVAWNLGTQAIRALMDDVPQDLSRRLIYRITDLPDVVPDSARVRLRFVGEQPFVEVTIGTPRGRSLEEAHQLTKDVERVVRAELQQADVLVHVEPARTAAESYTTTIYATAHRLGMNIHNLDLYQLAGEVRVEMDLELPVHLTLAEAHTHSERLEAAIAAELPCHTVVEVHLEPRRDDVQPAVRYAPITQQVRQVIGGLPYAEMIFRVETLLTEEGIIVTLHCPFPGATPLTEVHTQMSRIEQDLRRAIPNIVRVQIDPEPTPPENGQTVIENCE
jgi:cation diffusion facilitator family transporter